jgi:hypothetical protein
VVDQIGTGNPADDVLGDDRPPSRRSSALLVVVVLVIGGYAVTRLLDPPNPPHAAPAGATPTGTPAPTPPGTRSAIPSPYASAYPASAAPTPVPRPWAGLPVRRGPHVDFAVGDRVVAAGRDYRLDPGDRVLAMERGAVGPVVLVQSRGSTVLEQLRPDGSRLVLEAFHDESRLPHGLAVDPSGSYAAYGTSSGTETGPSGLVVRDLSTGDVVASRSTRLPYGVRDWATSGVVLTVALDPGGPPYRWVPGAGRPVRVTPPDRRHGGPFLLAAEPVGSRWTVTGNGCTGLVDELDARPTRQFCGRELGEPAAWSPDGDEVVARARNTPAVLDLRTGRTTLLRTPGRVFVSQLVWAGPARVLVAVRTLADGHGRVLSCGLPTGRCEQVALGRGGASPDLVLST